MSLLKLPFPATAIFSLRNLSCQCEVHFRQIDFSRHFAFSQLVSS
jgi:hypothetical protein